MKGDANCNFLMFCRTEKSSESIFRILFTCLTRRRPVLDQVLVRSFARGAAVTYYCGIQVAWTYVAYVVMYAPLFVGSKRFSCRKEKKRTT